MSKIQITCDTPKASIYYSINNNNLDQLYTTPFEINEEGEIYAIGKRKGYKDSEVSLKIINKENLSIKDPVISFDNDPESLAFILENIHDYNEDDLIDIRLYSEDSDTGYFSYQKYIKDLENQKILSKYNILQNGYFSYSSEIGVQVKRNNKTSNLINYDIKNKNIKLNPPNSLTVTPNMEVSTFEGNSYNWPDVHNDHSFYVKVLIDDKEISRDSVQYGSVADGVLDFSGYINPNPNYKGTISVCFCCEGYEDSDMVSTEYEIWEA